jgi:hypothetical protein
VCGRCRTKTDLAVDYHLPAVWTSGRRNYADECLSLLLRLSRVPRAAETCTRRLLCVLQLWFCPLSAYSDWCAILCVVRMLPFDPDKNDSWAIRILRFPEAVICPPLSVRGRRRFSRNAGRHGATERVPVWMQSSLAVGQAHTSASGEGELFKRAMFFPGPGVNHAEYFNDCRSDECFL